MRIILIHKQLNRIRHARLTQQLHLLRRQILMHQRMHPHPRQFLRGSQTRIVNAQLDVVHFVFTVSSVGGGFGGPFGPVEDEDVPRVGDSALEFLPETDGVGHFGYACCVDLGFAFSFSF